MESLNNNNTGADNKCIDMHAFFTREQLKGGDSSEVLKKVYVPSIYSISDQARVKYRKLGIELCRR